jgi:hypothetical protein
MELIKKTIYRIMTTGTTTGCTGTCRVIIPNTGVTYCLKIGLIQEAHDLGFFDVVEYPNYPHYPYYPYYETNNNELLSFDSPIGIENLFI